MSQENVEIVRRFADCWERLDWEGMAELVDPDVEQHGTVGGVEEGRVTRGVSAIRRDYEHVEAIWDEHRIEVQELIDAGDRVVSLVRIRAVGAGSGVAVERGDGMVWTFRNGKLARLDYFNDQEEALRAAGL
jgi:ketosteroid isomerase-like protein